MSVSALFREWGLPEYMVKAGKSSLRWRQPLEKGIAWYWFSQYIHRRDWQLGCISCGKPFSDEKEVQTGHFFPAQNCGNALLFSELNNNGECAGCNGFDEGHLHGYRKNLIARIGLDKVEEMEAQYFKSKQNIFSQDNAPLSKIEWENKARHYRNLYEAELQQ